MQTSTTSTSPHLTLFAALLLGLSLTLTACGGGDSDSRLDDAEDGEVGGGDPDDPEEEDPDAPTIVLGYGTGGDFVEGEIDVDLPDGSALSAGGSANLYVTLTNEEGDLTSEETTVSFSSGCLSSGGAELEGVDEDSESSVTTSSGSVTVQYHAAGCVGEDEVVASATSSEADDINSARATLTVEQDTLDQVQFIETTPNVIGIRGMGAQVTTAESRFRIVGANGSPIQEVPVNFELSSNAPEGANLAEDSATTNSEGYVTARVRSGTGAGVTNVIATANGVLTTSRDLVISTTIPTQRQSSLSRATARPVAWGTDGVTSELTVRLGDQNNNHILEGTAVSFTASAGLIDSQCLTNDESQCSVTWRSQGERPYGSGGVVLDNSPPYVTCPGGGECRNGRVAVLATTEGNESFIDRDYDGVFDPDSDGFATEGNCEPSEPRSYAPPAPIDQACDDLGPAYLDVNFNGVLDDGVEEVIDSTARNDLYNGVFCTEADHDAGLCSREPITLRFHTTLVMTSPFTYAPMPGLPGSVEIGMGDSESFDLLIADENGNGMPSGTTIEVNDSLAENAEFNLSRETLEGSSSEPTPITLQVKASEDDPVDGSFEVTVSYDGELESQTASTTFGPIPLSTP